MYIHPEFLS